MDILLAEDDIKLHRALVRLFENHEHTVHSSYDGQEALKQFMITQPDIVILDWGLPEVDGLEVCQRLRSQGQTTPILMLTARNETEDKVLALEEGADDYLAKPFESEELLARVHALARRSGYEKVEYIQAGDFNLEYSSHSAYYQQQKIELGRVEWKLLELFLNNYNKLVEREVIYQQVWGYVPANSNTLDVHVGYLRKKLSKVGADHLLKTIRSYGYQLGQ